MSSSNQYVPAPKIAKQVPPASFNVRDLIPDLVQAGELLSPESFLARSGWTGHVLRRALAARRIFFVDSGSLHYVPSFYADPTLNRRHLGSVTKLLGDLPGGSKWRFFTTPKGSLSRQTPIQAVRRGQWATVKVAAAGFAER